MPPRASWKGYLKLSLLQCAVALYPANTTSERVSFRTINRQTGNRLKQEMVDAETGEPVEREDRGKGYEVAKNEYLLIEDEELDKIKLESSETIDIEMFVPKGEIDLTHLDSSHYIAPDDKVAEEVFAIIREVMARKGAIGIGRVVLNRRERLLRLQPCGKGILATAIRYPYEVRASQSVFDEISDVEIPEEMIELATQIVERRMGHFDPNAYQDRYENALIELIKAKQAGRAPKLPKAKRQPAKVINIMDALKRSIEAEKKTGKAIPRRPAAASKRKPAAAQKTGGKRS